MSSASWLDLGRVFQLGVVTASLDASIHNDLELRPDATWTSWTYGPEFLRWQRIGGAPGEYQMTLAISGTDPQLELIVPEAGDTSLARFAASQGSGLHHVGIRVDDFAAESARLRGLGIAELEAGGGHGLDGDGAFGYFDTTDRCGVIVELIEPPRRRPAPHRTYSNGEARQ